MGLNSSLAERLVNVASEKVDQLEKMLENLCFHDTELTAALESFESFSGIKLEPKLIPVESSLLSSERVMPAENSTAKTSTQSLRRHPQKPGAYTEFCKKLPPLLKKVGARGKTFTTGDVVAAVKEARIKNFQPAWISLVLAKGMAGVSKVGKSINAAGRPVNIFKLNGKELRPGSR